jgi:hypothetical protein
MVRRVKIGEYFPSIKYIGWDAKYSVFWMNYYRLMTRLKPLTSSDAVRELGRRNGVFCEVEAKKRRWWLRLCVSDEMFEFMCFSGARSGAIFLSDLKLPHPAQLRCASA